MLCPFHECCIHFFVSLYAEPRVRKRKSKKKLAEGTLGLQSSAAITEYSNVPICNLCSDPSIEANKEGGEDAQVPAENDGKTLEKHFA